MTCFRSIDPDMTHSWMAFLDRLVTGTCRDMESIPTKWSPDVKMCSCQAIKTIRTDMICNFVSEFRGGIDIDLSNLSSQVIYTPCS